MCLRNARLENHSAWPDTTKSPTPPAPIRVPFLSSQFPTPRHASIPTRTTSSAPPPRGAALIPSPCVMQINHPKRSNSRTPPPFLTLKTKQASPNSEVFPLSCFDRNSIRPAPLLPIPAAAVTLMVIVGFAADDDGSLLLLQRRPGRRPRRR